MIKTIDTYPPILDLVRHIQHDIDSNPDGLAHFHNIATYHLQNFDCTLLDLGELFEWVSLKQIPFQPKFFGEAPITLFFSDTFVVDIYNWFEANTDIHNHGFSGAFTVLSGEIFQVKYSFLDATSYHDVFLGNLQPVECKLLTNSKQVETIFPGPSFIHKTVHLSPLTVTLCIRTCRGNFRQFGYYREGIAKHLAHNPKTYLASQLIQTCYKSHVGKIKIILTTLVKENNIQLFLDLAISYFYLTRETYVLLEICDYLSNNNPFREKLIAQLAYEQKIFSFQENINLIEKNKDKKIILELFALSNNKNDFLNYIKKFMPTHFIQDYQKVIQEGALLLNPTISFENIS